MKYNLILNPGSTSTKIAVYDGTTPILNETIRHSAETIRLAGTKPLEQKKFRLQELERVLKSHEIAPEQLTGVIAIGGLIRPCKAGVYAINEEMVSDLAQNRYHFHASNVGALIAYDLAQKLHIGAYIADANNTDEMQLKAMLSGMPELTRHMVAHTLNERGTAYLEARKMGKTYENCNFVIVHMGGGITITAHRKGRMIDGNAPRGEGPFCMDRTGGLNAYEVAQLCYSGKYSKEEMLRKITGAGGVTAYLNTTDFREVETRAKNGDKLAAEVFAALAYQIAKEIGAMSVALEGKVDAILLTGGLAYSEAFTAEITRQVSFLGRIAVYPGEVELETLAAYLDEIQRGARIAMVYQAEGEEK